MLSSLVVHPRHQLSFVESEATSSSCSVACLRPGARNSSVAVLPSVEAWKRCLLRIKASKIKKNMFTLFDLFPQTAPMLSLVQHELLDIDLNMYEMLCFYVETRKGRKPRDFLG
ncbi:unnamed protein product [Cuscuta europaea]|uniref:Uncharacterized protein n=1 Tax=Cuscuta europaea TaxID=41803 RepID=A0A9P0Z0J7_CUSEU|nr:unnamed protein product [Cuscuta europaea]